MAALGSASDGSPQVWTSSDGGDWSAATLPIADPGQPGSSSYLHAVGANNGVIVVFGGTDFDPERAIIDALPDDLNIDDEYPPYGFEIGGSGAIATIYGPLGIAALSFSAEDLGLSDEQVEAALFGGPETEGATTV